MKKIFILLFLTILISSCYTGKKFPKTFGQAEKYIEKKFTKIETSSPADTTNSSKKLFFTQDL